MPGIVDLIAAISIDVNASFVTAGLSPLTDGGIVVGRVHLEENSAPPRVIFVPRGSRFAPRSAPNPSPVGSSARLARNGSGVLRVAVTQFGSNYTAPTVTFTAPDGVGGQRPSAQAVVQNGAISAIALTSPGSAFVSGPPTVTISDPTGSGATAVAYLAPIDEKLRQMQQRSIVTDRVVFDVHCWGITSTTPDADRDFDAAQLVYQQVIASTYRVTGGSCAFEHGVWQDSLPGSTQIDVLGRYYVLTLSIDTPVLDNPLLYVPVGTKSNTTIAFQPFDGGTPESP